MRRFVSSPFAVPILSLSTLAALFLIGQMWSAFHANKVLTAIDLTENEPVDVEVYISFEPERFHLEIFQAVGRYLGWQGDHVLLLQARPDELRALAAKYWIDEVKLHEPGT